MDELELSNAVARTLAWVWVHHKQPGFLRYLEWTYSQPFAEGPRFEKLCLAEAVRGDFKRGAIHGEIKQWWLADDNGTRAVPWGEMPRFVDDFNEAEGTDRVFYRFPLIKFLCEGTDIAFGEAFGPGLNCRKLGWIDQSGLGVSMVDVELVWNSNSIMGVPAPTPLHALDIAEAGAIGMRWQD